MSYKIRLRYYTESGLHHAKTYNVDGFDRAYALQEAQRLFATRYGVYANEFQFYGLR